MRRVKDYTTYIKEDIETSRAAEEYDRILNLKGEKKFKLKSREEIESGLEGERSAVHSEWIFNEAKKGYVGLSSLFGGEVILREFEADGETDREYEVLDGVNEGVKGSFEWKGGGKKYPVFDEPLGKEFSELIPPGKEFYEKYKDNNSWRTIVSEIPGIEFIPEGDKGGFEIEYEDLYQMYGKVRIKHNPEGSYPYFKYEVLDGPNRGKSGNSISILEKGETFKGQGVLSSFSSTNKPSFLSGDGVDFPCNYQYPDSGVNDRVNRVNENKNIPATGYNPNHLIYLDTSEITEINPPSVELFKKSYSKSRHSGGGVIFGEDPESGGNNYVEKSKYNQTDLLSSGAPPKGEKCTISDLPIKGNRWGGCFQDVYFGNDIVLYSVPCQKGGEKLSWGEEVGTYGNNFFTGRFLTTADGKYIWKYLKGEWYWDFSENAIGLIYAYDDSGKKVDTMFNPEEMYENHYDILN